MRDRYQDLIDRIVTATLKGQIRSKAQIYDFLQEGVDPGTGELFERCLLEQMSAVQSRLATETDEMKQAKAQRQQRALNNIQKEWERWQQDNQSSAALSGLEQTLKTAVPETRLSYLLQALDPNASQALTRDQIHQLAKDLEQITAQAPEDCDQPSMLAEMAKGLRQGLATWQQLEGNVVGWIYDQSQRSLGFGGLPELKGPWASWAKAVNRDHLQQLFSDLARHQGVTSEGVPSPWSLPLWIETAIALQRLNLSLVGWFDQQPYDPKAGKRLSIATFLTFTAVWSQLSHRFSQLGQSTLAEGCFQVALQVLTRFAQQDYFPLYGGLFAALSDESLRTTLDYLDQPLRQAANTQTKARILTLLGYSQRALGRYDEALQFHEIALEIAREAGDRPCEIASLNHLSRTQVVRQVYTEAIGTSQRALILARQTGDRLGEANALANLGYSEVFQAQQADQLDPDQYERILESLQRGVQLSERVGDRPSQALCAHSLGVAQVVLGQFQDAIASLELGLLIAQTIGDRFLQGNNYTYLAEAHRGMDNPAAAILTGCLGMYLLHQIDSEQWRQPAGIVSILQGQMGEAAFRQALEQQRGQMLPLIGVDGYDYLPTLLEDYRRSLS
ncbi:MAG: tetratricopeptide repeat protein [Elainellaceae cyanobacterium]